MLFCYQLFGGLALSYRVNEKCLVNNTQTVMQDIHKCPWHSVLAHMGICVSKLGLGLMCLGASS